MRRAVIVLACALALAGAYPAKAQPSHHAKVVLDDGTPPPAKLRIIPQLTNELHPACVIQSVFADGTIIYYVVLSRTGDLSQLRNSSCNVTFKLPGYRDTDATLDDDATIVLKKIGGAEGATVSMSSLQAPEQARKEYEKGASAMARDKWAAAEKDFGKAVELYPAYAQAWSGLGEALEKQQKPREAASACNRAMQADPKYLKPYIQLTRMALAQGRMEEALGFADRALQLNPRDSATVYFFHAVANFNLKHLDAAEKSARRTIEIDVHHDIPRAESLLGLILVAKGDRRGAADHLRAYLALSPKATDAPEIKHLLTKLEH